MIGTITQREQFVTKSGKTLTVLVIDGVRYTTFNNQLYSTVNVGDRVEFTFTAKGDFKNIDSLNVVGKAAVTPLASASTDKPVQASSSSSDVRVDSRDVREQKEFERRCVNDVAIARMNAYRTVAECLIPLAFPPDDSSKKDALKRLEAAFELTIAYGDRLYTHIKGNGSQAPSLETKPIDTHVSTHTEQVNETPDQSVVKLSSSRRSRKKNELT